MDQKHIKESFEFETYHESSKLREHDIRLYSWIGFINTDASVRKIISSPVLEYGNASPILLPRNNGGSPSLHETLLRRRSDRSFSDAECSIDIFASVLQFALAECSDKEFDDGAHWSFRPYPSGGGLYPVDTYCIVNNIEGMERGIYYYDPQAHSVTRTWQDYDAEAFAGTMPSIKDEFLSSAFVIFLVSCMPRISFKYYERAYRFALLETGHMAQNLLLCATAAGLKSFPAGAYLDDRLNDLLNLDGTGSNVQYLLLFGT